MGVARHVNTSTKNRDWSDIRVYLYEHKQRSTIIFSEETPFKCRMETIYFLLLLMGTCVPLTLRFSEETLGSLEAASGFSLKQKATITTAIGFGGEGICILLVPYVEV